jgi:hypothetical protein
MLGFEVFASSIDIQRWVYSSTHFFMNVSKYKSFYVQLKFNLESLLQNQFFIVEANTHSVIASISS